MTTPTDNPTHPAAGEELIAEVRRLDAEYQNAVSEFRQNLLNGRLAAFAPQLCDLLTAERQKREAVEKRIAAINGQRNIMANAINAQDFVRYWAADEEIGKLVAGDYDHDLASNFDTLKARVAELEDQLNAAKKSCQIHSEALDKMIDGGNAELATLRQELEAAKKDNAVQFGMLQQARKHAGEARRQLADSTARVEALTKALAEAQQQFERLGRMDKIDQDDEWRLREGCRDGGRAVAKALTASAPTDAGQADAGAESAKAATDGTTEFVTRGGAHEHRYKNGPLLRWCPASSCTLEEFKRQCEEDSRKLLGLAATPPETTEVRAVEPQAEQAESETRNSCDAMFARWAEIETRKAIAPGHNPDKLTNEQVGEGWRLLRVGESTQEGDHYWNRRAGGWFNAGASCHPVHADSPTYRRRVSEGKGAK